MTTNTNTTINTICDLVSLYITGRHAGVELTREQAQAAAAYLRSLGLGREADTLLNAGGNRARFAAFEAATEHLEDFGDALWERDNPTAVAELAAFKAQDAAATEPPSYIEGLRAAFNRPGTVAANRPATEVTVTNPLTGPQIVTGSVAAIAEALTTTAGLLARCEQAATTVTTLAADEADCHGSMAMAIRSAINMAAEASAIYRRSGLQADRDNATRCGLAVETAIAASAATLEGCCLECGEALVPDGSCANDDCPAFGW